MFDGLTGIAAARGPDENVRRKRSVARNRRQVANHRQALA